MTSEAERHLTDDDRLTFPFLAKENISVVPVIWDQESIEGMDAIVVRSCWDYHRKITAFQGWCERLKSFPGKVFNPPSNLLWNLDKKYLFELKARGVRIPETKLLKRGTAFKSRDLEGFHDRIVVKPSVSLNGHDTFLLELKNPKAIQEAASEILRERDLLLQEYLPEIETKGELSFLFFNDEFSHAVKKLPAKGEFRIHAEYGGARIPYEPDKDQVARALEIHRRCSGEGLLYARVDVVERESELILMEYEIIDPFFYFQYAPGSAANFSRALVKRLRS